MPEIQFPVEQVVTVGGVSYRLARLNLSILHQFLEWCKSRLPDPFADFAARFGGLSEAVQRLAFERASRAAEVRGTLEDPAVTALMNSIDGAKHLLYLMFSKYQPAMSEADVSRVVDQAMEEQGDAFLASYFPSGQAGVGQPAAVAG